MSASPNLPEGSPERPISEICVNLESQFVNMQDLSKAEGMRVYARIRPMLASEIEAGYKECIGTADDQTVRAIVPTSSNKFKSSTHLGQDIIEDFTYTAAHGPEIGQFVFFQECMMNTMQNFIEGQNSLLFSYGTTGSGKTFTLQGNINNPGIIPLSLHLYFASIENQLLDRIIVKPDKFADVIVLNEDEIKKELEVKEQLLSSYDQEDWNSSSKSFAMLLCNTFSDNFEAEERKTTLSPEDMVQAQAAALMKELSKKSALRQTGYCSIWVSFVEIYNETIYDLLQPNINQRSKLVLGEDKNGDVYVKGLREVCVSNSYEALKLLNFGQKNLNIASTKLNYSSSRSHCIFTVKVVRIHDLDNVAYAKVNRLSFCDLAGSERAAKSQTTGIRLKEANYINTSLLVLGKCLEQLRLRPSQREKKLIPFRESKLTRLFSGFFTGRGRAIMIANASPSELTFDETLHVLRFSALAKELIINDSYIATASSTLQSITKKWTTARANVSDFSDKSISFEDSSDELMLEKDQIIEKLLDLAESLRNNLEKEKKEKAELEIKLRQDISREFSEYSNELLENQRENFAEERQTIIQIYEKRLSAMKKVYEEFIADKMASEGGDSSEEESFEVIESKNKIETTESSEYAEMNKCMKPIDNVISDGGEVCKRTKEELNKTVDYSLSLETELETLQKELENIKLQLKTAMKDSDEAKKEIENFKIECYAFETRNDGLLKEKAALMQDLKSLTDDLESVSLELKAEKETQINLNTVLAAKEAMISQLETELDDIKDENAENKVNLQKAELSALHLDQTVKELKVEIHKLNDVNLENVKKLNEAFKEYDRELRDRDEILKSVNDSLDNAFMYNKMQIEKMNALEAENASLKKEISVTRNLEKNSDLENMVCNEEFDMMSKRLSEAELTIEKQNEELEKLRVDKKELNELREINKQLEEKIALETENVVCKKEFDMMSKKMSEAELTIEKQNEELVKLRADKKEIDELREINKQLKEKINLETENVVCKEEFDMLNKKLSEAKLITDKQSEELEKLRADKKKIDELREINKQLEERITLEAENVVCKKEFDMMNKKLNEAESTIDKQNEDLENLKYDKKEIDELREINEQLKRTNLETELSLSAHKQELDNLCSKLEDAELNICKQQEDIKNLSDSNNLSKSEIKKLVKSNEELTDKLNFEVSQKGIILELVQALEKIECVVTNKTERKKSEYDQLKTELDDLSGQIKMDHENHKKVCSTLFKLIEVLQKCELFATENIKQLHSISVDNVEKMMDLEKSVKEKEMYLEKLQNDQQVLIKEFQSKYKKQKQQFMIEMDHVKNKVTAMKKENSVLQDKLTQVTAEKEKLEELNSQLEAFKENRNIITESGNDELKGDVHNAVDQNEKTRKRSTPNRRSKEKNPVKELLDNNESLKKTEPESVELKKEVQNVVDQNEKTKKRCAPNRHPKEKRKLRNIQIVSENQALWNEVYVDPEESNNGKTEKERNAGKRHLKCLDNVKTVDCVVKLEDINLNKKALKRKQQKENADKIPEQENLKRMKLHDIDTVENVSKSQNLRVQLLKTGKVVSDIAASSPRMTRGRKRLVNLQNAAQGKTSSPRTVRS